MTLPIRGFGGGGKTGSGSQHTPVESPDTLHSISHARVLDLISEGVIQGFKHGAAAALQDVYLDRTPAQNADGSLNFKDFQFDSRVGLQTQDYIPGFNSVENEIIDGVGLIYGTPISISLTHTYLSAVRVLLSVASLSKADAKTGDIGPYSVGYTIELSVDGGSFYNVLTGSFSGKTNTKYTRSHRIDLPAATYGWIVRISRTTATATSSLIQDLTFVESHTEVIDGKFTYPNSAYCASNFNAAQFQQVPVRAFDVYGRIIRVPSNYNPITRQYTGSWDGTFQSAWTNNPAWIYYDMATNSRFGLGQIIADSQIDKWALYTIAQYCDGYVTTGKPARASVTTGSISLAAGASSSGLSVTGVASTDILTATAHGFAVGDAVTFSGMTGGFGIFAGVPYYVIAANLTANTFQVALAGGGSAVGFSVDMTAGTVTRAPSTYVRTTGSFLTDGFAVGDEVNATGFSNSANNGRGVILAVSALVMTLATDHVLVAESAGTGKTIATQAPTEPRFTFNAQIQAAGDAYKLLQDMASCFRGISYYAGGMITAIADMPQSPVYTYSNSNVIGGKFTYSGSSKTARHTVALVSWSDDSDFGAAKVEYVFDNTAVARYGIVPVQISTFGNNSQSQAQRAGRHLLLSERLCTQMVSFSVGLDGTVPLPGKIIQISDSARAGRRIGGRVSSATSTTITVDAQPSTPIANGDTLTVIGADGTLQTRTVSGVAGNVVTVSVAFTSPAVAQSQWSNQTATLSPQLFRVLSVTENPGIEFAITGIQYNASIYSGVDSGTLINIPPVTAIPTRYLSAPASVTLTSNSMFSNNTPQTILTAMWPAVTGATGYKVEWRRDPGDWEPPVTVRAATVDYQGAIAGTWYARVSSLGDAGISSPYTQSAALAVVDGPNQWSADNLLTPDEKPSVRLDYTNLVAEQSGLDAQADALSITTEKSAYDAALAALNSYMATLTTPVLWSDQTDNTNLPY